jgi:hypothetical protein
LRQVQRLLLEERRCKAEAELNMGPLYRSHPERSRLAKEGGFCYSMHET